MNALPTVTTRTILTPTSGFLGSGFTHSLNPYQGCSFANSACGTFCYAQHNGWITRGRPWGLYAGKAAIGETYRRDHDRLKRPRRGDPKALRVYMSSSTDPYLPQEKTARLTRAVLEAMQDRPPDALVLQTRALLVERDQDLLLALAARCQLWLSVTVETDMDPIPGFPPHASPPAKRLQLLRRVRVAGVRTQATLSPLLPIADLPRFAADLDRSCDRVIVDHYLLGDGTAGKRTARTPLPGLLAANGFQRWTTLEPFHETVDALRAALGSERVLISEAGFNAL